MSELTQNPMMSHVYQLNENIHDNLKWLRTHNELCDVLLVYGNHQISAHSCVLASSSPLLAAILQARLVAHNDWSILKPLVISMEQDSKYADNLSGEDVPEINVLDLLISFLYGELIMIDPTQIEEFINFSKLLGLSQYFNKDVSPESNHKDSNCSSLEKKCKRKQAEQTSAERNPSKEYSLNVSKLINNAKEIKLKDKSVFTLENKNEANFQNKRKLNGNLKWLRKKAVPTVTKNSTFLLKDFLSNEDADFTKANDTTTVLEPDPTRTPITAQYDNLNDTESWFKNELLNAIETKDVANKCETDLAAGNEDKNFSKMENIENKTNFLPKNHASKNQMKRTTRIATSCSVCKSSFHRANDLIKHVKDEKHYSEFCPLCFVQMSEYDAQKSHFLQHDHPLPFFCFCCDLRFRSRAGLAMHAPKHSNTKPYTCQDCGRGFKWRQAAQAHSITHRSHRHLLCDICGFASKYNSTFASHLLRHSDQGFPCPHAGCPFKAFRKTRLTEHVATHAKLRPHQCEVCGHSFSQAKNLRRHMRLHTPDTFFLKCALFSHKNCPFKTTRPDKLRFHLIQKHNLEHHDKISLPAHQSTQIPSVTKVPDTIAQESSEMSEEVSEILKNSEEVKKNMMGGSHSSHTTAGVVYKDFDFTTQAKDEIFSVLEGSGSTKECGTGTGTGKEIGVSVMSGDISDMLLGDRSTLLPSQDTRLSDSYDTFILPTLSHNTVIVTDTMEYSNQGMEDDSGLVLMGNVETVLNLPSSEENGSLNVSSAELDNNFSQKKSSPISTSKIDEIINNLPTILHDGDKNLTYLNPGHLNPTDTDTSYAHANLDEFNQRFNLDQDNQVNQDNSGMTLEDGDRNIQLFKLADGSIGFLPHVPDNVGTIEENPQFNLNSLF